MQQFSKWILEAWATWEALRRLGFSADEIFWEFVPTLNAQEAAKFGCTVPLALNIALRTQDRVFNITCSEALTEEQAKLLMCEAEGFQTQLSTGQFQEAELQDVLHASYIWDNSVGLLAALQKKGFVFPCTLS